MSSPSMNSGQATPSGTVTFLFTDIEGSTKLAQEYPDELPALLSRHNEILKGAIQEHKGYVFQIVGDSFSAPFQNAVDAVYGAVDAQSALQHSDLGVLRELRGLKSIDSVRTPAEQKEFEEAKANLESRMDKNTFDKAWEEGRSITMEETIEFALEVRP